RDHRLEHRGRAPRCALPRAREVRMNRSLFLAALFFACSCSPSGPPAPAPLETANEACRHCRMMVSDAHFAAQLVAPGEEPLFFDDVGCLRDYLREHAKESAGFTAYVADHRTRAWILKDRAAYTRVE